MIHGVYLRSNPKKNWQLMSMSISAETASQDLSDILNKAKNDGFDKAEAIIHTFTSTFYIPENIKEIKSNKILFN